MSEPRWQTFPSGAPDLFTRLEALQGRTVLIRFGIGTGSGIQVEVPAARMSLQGRLEVRRSLDRIIIHVEGWGEEDFAWFGRRKGRGRPDYWQGAIEYRPSGAPAMVLYFTAPLDSLEIRIRQPGECPPTWSP